jgi:hypothetical protein
LCPSRFSDLPSALIFREEAAQWPSWQK